MSGQVLIGRGRDIHSMPDDDFLKAMDRLPKGIASRLAFMSRDHHAVRDFVVREMPRQNRAISPMRIAATTGMMLSRVIQLLGELEAHLFFLVRDAAGNASWAFPVTIDRTAHRLSFSTGEKTFGA